MAHGADVGERRPVWLRRLGEVVAAFIARLPVPVETANGVFYQLRTIGQSKDRLARAGVSSTWMGRCRAVLLDINPLAVQTPERAHSEAMRQVANARPIMVAGTACPFSGDKHQKTQSTDAEGTKGRFPSRLSDCEHISSIRLREVEVVERSITVKFFGDPSKSTLRSNRANTSCARNQLLDLTIDPDGGAMSVMLAIRDGHFISPSLSNATSRAIVSRHSPDPSGPVLQKVFL
ncbi:hypothetical protein ACVWZ3_000517 [Bradyrhizobium sp. i1.3.6]